MESRRWVRNVERYAAPVLLAVIVAAGGAVAVVRAADAQVDEISRVSGLDDVLTPVGEAPDTGDDDSKPADDGSYDSEDPLLTEAADYSASNYLIVGSDSRERASDYEFDKHIGTSGSVGGQRSDVIMVLRQEANGPASLLSIPRDLWTDISGHKPNRINAAYNYGPEVLVKTITEELGIPINHYIEVDFFGFQEVIDSIGGVEMCLGHAARDTHTGLQLDAGCQTLDGTTALQWARSRYYQESNGSRWVSDPTGDRGRVIRQQEFIRAAVYGVLRELQESPFSGNDILNAVSKTLTIDEGTDALRAARALRSAMSAGLTTYVIPTYDARVGNAAVLKLADGSQEVLDYFAGKGPAPLDQATGAMTENALEVPIPRSTETTEASGGFSDDDQSFNDDESFNDDDESFNNDDESFNNDDESFNDDDESLTDDTSFSNR